MTKKPKGLKYRNLYARGAVIYVELVKDGERFPASPLLT